jgi:hypothetical protein
VSVDVVTTSTLRDLLVVFDELLPPTNEQLKQYWFHATRADGISVTLVLDDLQGLATVIVRSSPDVAAADVALSSCSSVRVLDTERRVIEIMSEARGGHGTRCLLALSAGTILQCREFADESRPGSRRGG